MSKSVDISRFIAGHTLVPIIYTYTLKKPKPLAIARGIGFLFWLKPKKNPIFLS